jgi:hypothetical protein
MELKELHLEADHQYAIGGLEGQFAAPSHAEIEISGASTKATTDRYCPLIYSKDAVARDLHRNAFKALWPHVSESVEQRGSAVGSPLMNRINSDGTLSRRRVVPSEVLDEIEARQLVLQRGSDNKLLGLLRPLAEVLAAQYKEHAPELYRRQYEAADRSRLFRTPFTHCYLAKQFPTAYHYDSGNLPGVYSVMTPLGNFQGGALVLPRWGIRIPYVPGDVILFDANQLHGNLFFEGERLAVVCYCRA